MAYGTPMLTATHPQRLGRRGPRFSLLLCLRCGSTTPSPRPPVRGRPCGRTCDPVSASPSATSCWLPRTIRRNYRYTSNPSDYFEQLLRGTGHDRTAGVAQLTSPKTGIWVTSQSTKATKTRCCHTWHTAWCKRSTGVCAKIIDTPNRAGQGTVPAS